MLTIRMQRLGRKGHPTYRVVVQDVRQTPTSGKYVAMLGSYDPHSKVSTLVKDKAQFYLDNGAQPSDRVVRLFASEGLKLPEWVKPPSQHTRSLRNADKLRRNRPEEPKEEVNETPAAEGTSDTEAPTEEAPQEVNSSPDEANPESAEQESPASAKEESEATKSEVTEPDTNLVADQQPSDSQDTDPEAEEENDQADDKTDKPADSKA